VKRCLRSNCEQAAEPGDQRDENGPRHAGAEAFLETTVEALVSYIPAPQVVRGTRLGIAHKTPSRSLGSLTRDLPDHRGGVAAVV
jgi:hypothetical protein